MLWGFLRCLLILSSTWLIRSPVTYSIWLRHAGCRSSEVIILRYTLSASRRRDRNNPLTETYEYVVRTLHSHKTWRTQRKQQLLVLSSYSCLLFLEFVHFVTENWLEIYFNSRCFTDLRRVNSLAQGVDGVNFWWQWRLRTFLTFSKFLFDYLSNKRKLKWKDLVEATMKCHARLSASVGSMLG